MRNRRLGRSNFEVSRISFGCGGTAGLMVRGTHQEQCDVISEAISHGINVFDTSPTYGGGHSETNLGKVLKTLGATPIVSTKVDFAVGDLEIDLGADDGSGAQCLQYLAEVRLGMTATVGGRRVKDVDAVADRHADDIALLLVSSADHQPRSSATSEGD